MNLKQKTEGKLRNLTLTLAVAIGMMIGLLPAATMTVSASDDAAASVTINGTTTSYNTFSEAVSAWAGADEATLTLLQDSSTSTQIAVTGTKTLDLNGKTLTSTADSSAVLLSADDAVLTVTDTSDAKAGKITHGVEPNTIPAINIETGTLNVDGGTVQSTRGDAIRASGGTLNVTGGVVEAPYAAVQVPAGKSGTVDIKGGSIKGGGYGNVAIELHGGGTFALSGDTVVSASMGIQVGKDYTGNVTISGGTINGSGDYSLSASNTTGAVEVSGGTFNGPVKVSAIRTDGISEELKNTAITGGVFNKGLRTENFSRPLVSGGLFKSNLNTSNYGPHITGGVFEQELVVSTYSERDSLKAYVEKGYSVVDLVDETYRYGVIGAAPSMDISADPEDGVGTYGERGVKLTAAVPAITTQGASDSESFDIAWTYNWTKGDSTDALGTEAVYTTGREISDSGTYKCAAASGDVTTTASKVVTIGKADPTAKAPEGLTASYGQTLADVTLTNPEGNTEGSWAWVDDATTSVGNAGTNTFRANFTPEDTTHYKSVSNVEVTVTVAKADNPATVTETATVSQGGKVVDLSGNVALNGATGAVSYEISGDANGCSISGSELTSGSAVGSVTVNAIVAGDDNYKASEAMPITVTITKDGAEVAVKQVTVNVATVNAKAVNAAVAKAGGSSKSVTTIVLGAKVKKISKSAFKSYPKAKTLVVKTKKLKKGTVKQSLKGSKITKVKVRVGTKKVNKKYVKKYKKIFTKKIVGKKVKVSL